MEFWEALINLVVNNGVAVAVIAYFCVRDWKFQNTLVETLSTIKEMVKSINEKEVRDDD